MDIPYCLKDLTKIYFSCHGLPYGNLSFGIVSYSFLSIKLYVCTWVDLLFVNMVLEFRLFDEKVERDLELESL
jgi:hypothetical protein